MQIKDLNQSLEDAMCSPYLTKCALLLQVHIQLYTYTYIILHILYIYINLYAKLLIFLNKKYLCIIILLYPSI